MKEKTREEHILKLRKEINTNTSPVNKEEVKKTIKTFCKTSKLAYPPDKKIYFCDSHLQALRGMAKIRSAKEWEGWPTQEEFLIGENHTKDDKDKLGLPILPVEMDIGLLSFMKEKRSQKQQELLTSMIELARVCHNIWLFDKAAIVLNRPMEVHLDTEFRYHNEDGPAVVYRDGIELYLVHGEIIELLRLP